MSVDESGLKSAVRRRGSFPQTLRAVAWSFFGVRKAADLENDVNRLNPVHVVIAGVLGALVLIGVLMSLVNWVVSSGAAAA